MSDSPIEEIQWAVEVEGKGYVYSVNPLLTIGPRPVVFMSHEEALSIVQRSRILYHSMGCPELIPAVQIVRRTVTTTYTDWERPKEIERAMLGTESH